MDFVVFFDLCCVMLNFMEASFYDCSKGVLIEVYSEVFDEFYLIIVVDDIGI